MSKKNSDQLFTDLFQKDRIGEPDQAIEKRLMYSFMLKSSITKPRQNSFASFFGWIFSAQSLGLKTGLATVVLFISLMNSHISLESVKLAGNDSISAKKVLTADTLRLFQGIDSIHYNSLN